MGPVPLAKKQCACMLSRVQLFASLWIIALQAPLSMGFSRQEYWSGLLCPPPGHLTNPGIKPLSLMSPALAVSFFTTSTAWEVQKGMLTDKLVYQEMSMNLDANFQLCLLELFLLSIQGLLGNI